MWMGFTCLCGECLGRLVYEVWEHGGCLDCVQHNASQNVVTWTAILGECAMHGHGKEALKHFEHV
jgi:hypothetical protein